MYFNDDRKLLESATKIVEEIVSGLPKAEQSEYHKRVRTYQNCFAQKNKLVKDKNWLYENYQAKAKEAEKSKLIGVCMFLAYLVANWIFNFVSENKMETFVVFILAYVGYGLLSVKISDSEYSLKMKAYEFEIARYETEISNLGIYTSIYRYNDMENYETFSEAIQSKMRFENECYYTSYCLEILKAMCIVDDITEEARLRIVE